VEPNRCAVVEKQWGQYLRIEFMYFSCLLKNGQFYGGVYIACGLFVHVVNAQQVDSELLGRVEPATANASTNNIGYVIGPDLTDPAQFELALSEDQLQEGETVAKIALEQLLQDDNATYPDRVLALSNLALVQKLMNDYASSALNYTAAIDIVVTNEDMLSERLIAPLRGLAATYVADGNYATALSTYHRALHISQVNDGPHTMGQVDILDSMIDTNMLAGEVKAAFEVLTRLNILFERKYTHKGIELIPVLNRRAELLNRLDRHGAERQTYLQIVDIMEDNYDEFDLALIKPYLALADTYLYQLDTVVYRSEPTTQTGETYLKKALKVAEGNSDASPEIIEECILSLGDYYMLMRNHGMARKEYQRAWNLMSSDPRALERRKARLETAMPLRRPAMGSHIDFDYGWDLDDIDTDELLDGHITARFSVTNRGRVTDVELIEAEPPNLPKMETRVRWGVRDFFYRPRFEAGVPVKSTQHTYRHDFVYLPSDLVPAR